ncbi:MAG TPA: hypothetical protein VNW52_10350 [Burkholderiaceae bacterium]|nr:hypothetical protein [Burkholderiaceae bacterium]
MSIGYRAEFATVVSANPGFFVLHPILDEFGMTIGADHLPVLAWGIDANDYHPYPIVKGRVYFRESPFLMEPDGTIERLMMDSFLNYEEWLYAQQINFINKKKKSR